MVIHHAGFALDAAEIGAGPDAWARRAFVGVTRLMNLGVPIFFVISGYCIAASADANRRRGASSWTFLGRRFHRIYPPYWAALLGFAACMVVLDAAGLERLHAEKRHALELASPGYLNWSHWLGNITLTETWRPLVWGHPAVRIFTRIAWTLC